MGKVEFLFCMLFVISMGKEEWDSITGKHCLQCLCLSMTNCNTSFGCQGNSDPYVCGPFSITLGYWIDSACPVLKEEAVIDIRSYARCVNDLECAKRAVEKYMDKFGRDCNGDGIINCYDYFGGHFFGFLDCINSHPLSTEEIIFHRCMNNTADPY